MYAINLSKYVISKEDFLGNFEKNITSNIGLFLNTSFNPKILKIKYNKSELYKTDLFNCFYFIVCIYTHEILGFIEIVDYSIQKNEFEIGFEIFPLFRNKGIMTNAMYLFLLDNIFIDYNILQVKAVVTDENIFSESVLLKNNFILSKYENSFKTYIKFLY